MYFRALLLSGCIALAGCQSAQIIEQQPSVTLAPADHINELSVIEAGLPSTSKVSISDTTQILRNDFIDSPVAVFSIPANRGQLSLKITSDIKDTVFVPYAAIYDESGKVLETYGEESFSYYKPKFHLGNRLVADVDFYPPTSKDKVYVVVYTKKEVLDGVTEVAHPARLDAEGRGNYMPEIKDIPVPHSLQGSVELEVSGPRFSLFNSASSSSENVTVHSPEMATKVTTTARPETQAYFLTEIDKAVAEKDIPKALSLLDEAKALNIEGAQKAFVDAVEKY